MAKWYGTLGFVQSSESAPGVWKDVVTKVETSGDLMQFEQRSQNSEKLTDDISFSNRISVLMDPFMMKNFQYLKFASFANSYWKVSSVNVQYPRMIFTLGGVYNGKVSN